MGLRREDKNEWERRVPLTPTEVEGFTTDGLQFDVERFERRAFPDAAYEQAGARLVDDVRDCDVVLGVKEIPVGYAREGGAYVFFSHTIKGQSYNMPLLHELVDRGCTLIDYEKITDDSGRRLIFFSYHAGIVGMTDSLWTLGRRAEVLGIQTPFLDLQPTHAYADLAAVKQAVKQVGERIATEGLPEQLSPCVVGITGYGNVSRGAQEILDLLPYTSVQPGDLSAWIDGNQDERHKIAKVIYAEENLVQPVEEGHTFELQEYYDHPEAYQSIFGPQLGLHTLLINAIYWDERYPKLADADQLRRLFAADSQPKLLAVGDISCDVDGSLACTVKETDAGDPVYIYNPDSREIVSGFEGDGLAVMAVGNLPSELPVEASETFGESLKPWIPGLADTRFSGDFDGSGIPAPLGRATILWRGEFTPPFEYMREFLD